MIGLYIDSLDEASKDRIIMAQNWCFGQLTHETNRCLVGHVRAVNLGFVSIYDVKSRYVDLMQLSRETSKYGQRFDCLCRRYGLEKIVNLCKIRAAKNNKIIIPQKELKANVNQ